MNQIGESFYISAVETLSTLTSQSRKLTTQPLRGEVLNRLINLGYDYC